LTPLFNCPTDDSLKSIQQRCVDYRTNSVDLSDLDCVLIGLHFTRHCFCGNSL